MQSFSLPVSKEKVDTKASTIHWKGYKVVGSHEGDINLNFGFLDFKNGTLAGGEFSINMSSIICTDLEGEYKGQLEGHLKNADFFDTENHPNATLKITEVAVGLSQNAYHLTADLTIKGITQEIEFDATLNDGTATANIKIDRTKFGIKYGSGSFFEGLGDRMIYNEFDLAVNLKY